VLRASFAAVGIKPVARASGRAEASRHPLREWTTLWRFAADNSPLASTLCLTSRSARAV